MAKFDREKYKNPNIVGEVILKFSLKFLPART
jgi:hypothetical protein